MSGKAKGGERQKRKFDTDRKKFKNKNFISLIYFTFIYFNIYLFNQLTPVWSHIVTYFLV